MEKVDEDVQSENSKRSSNEMVESDGSMNSDSSSWEGSETNRLMTETKLHRKILVTREELSNKLKISTKKIAFSLNDLSNITKQQIKQ